MDLETRPVEISTTSHLGSGDQINMSFSTSQKDWAGGIWLRFTSPAQYVIQYCTTSWTSFPADLPPDADKVWIVTLTRTSGIRVVIHCNEVEVLNFLISDSTCSHSDWSKYWRRRVAKIIFHSDVDTASDYYRPMRGD
jgi:hypothetical protein